MFLFMFCVPPVTSTGNVNVEPPKKPPKKKKKVKKEPKPKKGAKAAKVFYDSCYF